MGKYKCAGARRGVCDYEADQPWLSTCPACGRFYDIVRSIPREQSNLNLANLANLKPPEKMDTGCPAFNLVLNGGIVPGSTTVLTGAPGAGKSTLLMSTADAIAKKKKVLYCSGEQNVEDCALIAQRLGIENPLVEIRGNQGDVYAITSEAEHMKPIMVVVDSAQTAFVSDVGGDVGSTEQIKAVANWLTSFGKVEKIAVLIVSHVTKEGTISGPKVFEHLVDTIVYLDFWEEEDDYDVDEDFAARLREISVGKNRYGVSGVREVLELSERGLHAPSKPVSKRIITNFDDPQKPKSPPKKPRPPLRVV